VPGPAGATGPTGPTGAAGPLAIWQPKPLAGRFLALAALNSTNVSTLAGAADRLEVAFVPPRPYALVCDQLVVDVSTQVAAALGRIVVYSCDVNGWPDAKVYESAALDFSTLGAKTGAGFTFAADTPYWVGVHHSSTATLRSLVTGALVALDVSAGTGTNTVASVVRRTSAFAGGAPSPFGFAAAQITNNVGVAVVRGRTT
jgi:hypothetical protein